MNLKKELDKHEFEPPDLNLSEPSSGQSTLSTADDAAERNRTSAKSAKHSIVEFNSKIDEINMLLSKTKRAASDLLGVSDNAALDITRPDTRANQKRQQAYETGMRLLETARQLLQDLSASLERWREGENEAMGELPPTERKYSANFRKMQELLQLAEKSYITESERFEQAEMVEKAALDQKIRRMCRYLNPALTEQQIDAAVQQGESGIQQLALNSQSEFDALLEDAQEKHEMTLQFQHGTEELLDATKQMQSLVEQQGMKLASIYEVVLSAREDVQKGVKNLVTANKHAKTTKGCICCLIFLCVVILVIVLLIVLGLVKIF